MSTEIKAEMMANVWAVPVEVGQAVEEGETLVVLESMKMEIQVKAPSQGEVSAVLVAPQDPVQQGDVLVVLD